MEIKSTYRHWSELRLLVEPCKKIAHPLRLSSCEMIQDVAKMVEFHSSVIDTHSGNKLYLPYYERLLKVYYICLEQNLI